ncbi:MAG: NAD-dependent epimerase/dehydratase family protein [bacterium]
MGKKVFVTGGAGFIGSQLVDRLVEEGASVTVYDDLSSGKKEFIAQHLGKASFQFIQADLLDLPKLIAGVKGYDLVFHLAANPDIRLGLKYTDTDLKQSTIVTYNVLEAMRLGGVKEIAFSSTSTIYGEPTVMPTPENYGPLLPISLYGASKLACEALCTSFAHSFGLKCWIFRFANIVGGRGTHGIIYDFIGKLQKNSQELEVLGDGKQTKSYLLVDDCIDAMLYVYGKSKEQFNLYNLGTGDQTELALLAQIMVERSGLKNVHIKYTGGERGWPGDVPQMLLSVDKVNQLGWKAKYNSRQAIEIAVERMLQECKL